jgi:hypothetical protein
MRLVAAVLAVAVGCAGGARYFTLSQANQLALGKTTAPEVVSQFGPPHQRGTVLKDGVEVLSLSYSYADAQAPSTAPGVAAVKALALYFARDILVGYESLSTFRADSSDFDDTRVSDIARGTTTEAQVRELVGRPSGMYVYPLTRAPDERALVFLYGLKKGAAPLARKYLVITLDGSGIVRDVLFEKSGDW